MFSFSKGFTKKNVDLTCKVNEMVNNSIHYHSIRTEH